MAVLLIAVTVGCGKKNSAKKNTGIDGNRNWHGYNTVDRFYYSHTGADSASLHDTTAAPDKTFALQLIGNTQLKYNNQYAVLTTNTDSLRIYTYQEAVSATKTQYVDIYYYRPQDSIVIASVLVANISDTPVKQTDKYYSRLWTYKK